MSGVGDVTNGDRRTQLEQRAEAVRSRLGERLEVLDERRDRIVHMAKAATRPPVSIILLSAAGVAVTVLIVRSLQRRQPSSGERFRRALAAGAPRRSEGFFMRAFKRAALSLVVTAVQRASTRGLDRLMAESTAHIPAATIPRPRPR